MALLLFNALTPNDLYISRTGPLTSKRCISYIYSTNIGTEYFKHALYSPFFLFKCSLFHNANLFGSCIIHILYTGYAKIKKKNNSGAKGLIGRYKCQSLEFLQLLNPQHIQNMKVTLLTGVSVWSTS